MLDRIFTDQCKGICHRQSDKFTGLPNVEPFATISGVAHCTKKGKKYNNSKVEVFFFENIPITLCATLPKLLFPFFIQNFRAL